MRKHIVWVIPLLFVFFSCEKKIKKYNDIELFAADSTKVFVSSLPGEISVFTFVSPECPLSENYTRTLLALQEEYKDRDIHFFYIFPGTFYPKAQIMQFLKLYKLPVENSYFDPDYHFRDYCKASITPEAFIIDWAGNIKYSGAIDNWAITLGKQRQVITEHYVSEALTELLEGDKVSQVKTRAVGCIIE